MSSTKNVQIYGMVAKAETTYGTSSSPSTSDGVLLEERGELQINYAVDGARPGPPGTLGTQKRVGGGGRTATYPARVAMKGAGAAYSSSVTPAGHALLLASGLTGALTSTSGAEAWTYTPTPGPTGYGSATSILYARGEQYTLLGCYGDLTIAADGPVVPVAEMALQAILSTAIADASVPSITYPLASVIPPKAVGMSFTLGNFTAGKLRSFSFKLGREITNRLSQNASDGHAGFAIGRRAPTLEVTFESEALASSPYHSASALDPYQLFANATSLACSFTVGSTQYNRWTFSAPAVQIGAPPVLAEDGPSALWTLTLQCNPSTLNGNDDFSIAFN